MMGSAAGQAHRADMSIINDKPSTHSLEECLRIADDRGAVAETRNQELRASVTDGVNANHRWTELVRPFQKRLVRRRIALVAAMILGYTMAIAGLLLTLRPLELADTEQLLVTIPLGSAGVLIAWGSLILLLFLLDNDHYSLYLTRAAAATDEMRASGIKLLGISANSMTATLAGGWVGGDGVAVRTDRIDESLPDTQALLDRWAKEDAAH